MNAYRLNQSHPARIFYFFFVFKLTKSGFSLLPYNVILKIYNCIIKIWRLWDNADWIQNSININKHYISRNNLNAKVEEEYGNIRFGSKFIQLKMRVDVTSTVYLYLTITELILQEVWDKSLQKLIFKEWVGLGWDWNLIA